MEYVIYDECYFCLPSAERSGKKFCPAIVMRADVEKGGDPSFIDHTILVEAAKAREATSEDCERFMVKVE